MANEARKITKKEMKAKRLNRLDKYHATQLLMPEGKAAWKNIKNEAKKAEIYCDCFELDNLFKNTISIGRGNDFAEYIKTCVTDNP